MKKEIKEILYTILKLNQKELKVLLLNELIKYYKEVNYVEGGIVVNGYENQITVVAHMDRHPRMDAKVEEIIECNNILSSPNGICGDDRCGIAIILYLIRNGYKPNIIFTEDEEIGCLGTHNMLKDITKFNSIIQTSNYLVQLDRRNTNEAIFYGYNNKEFIDYILSFGFVKEEGSSTDIRYLREALNLAAVNISVGYENEHTRSETINLDYTSLACKQVIDMIKDNSLNNIKYKYKEEVYYG